MSNDDDLEAKEESILSERCNPHPDAPHGFDRNASYTEDRYVCDCEWWVPPDFEETSSPSLPPKSDQSLRDRISDAVVSLGGFCRGDANEIADAVIAELGLRLEPNYESWFRPNGKMLTRYVTDWKADDE